MSTALIGKYFPCVHDECWRSGIVEAAVNDDHYIVRFDASMKAPLGQSRSPSRRSAIWSGTGVTTRRRLGCSSTTPSSARNMKRGCTNCGQTENPVFSRRDLDAEGGADGAPYLASPSSGPRPGGSAGRIMTA